MNGESVGKVPAFEYLGSLIDKNGDCSKEVKRRLAMAYMKLLDMEVVAVCG